MRVPCLLLCFFTGALFAQSPLRPFPQHAIYTAGSIRPSTLPQAGLDAAVAAFYDAWKARYLHLGCVPGQLYVAYNREKTAENKKAISCSEGHGYGMLLTALMAGHDPDARSEFDALYAFFRAHPSRFSPDLMAWQQITGCVDAKDGNDSATDGDLDIAYSLLLADAQWGSAGPIAYRNEALKVIAAIKAHEIHSATPSIALGDWALAGKSDIRLSDFMANHFRVFSAVTHDPLWPALIERGYSTIDFLQSRFAPATGLVPDFARKLDTGKPEPAAPNFLESSHDGDYFYNSCRFPWRLTTDYLLSGDVRAKVALEKINNFIEQKAGGHPEAIRAGYILASGKVINKEDTSLAFNAPFAVSAMVDARHQQWLDRLWNDLEGAPIGKNDYFGNTLKALCMVVLSSNWWAPQDLAPR